MNRMVRRSCFFVAAFLLFWAAVAGAHTTRIPVVIDTDMALDDIRAISMLVNAEFADIRLCVTSDGAVSPETGAANARRLLHFLGREDIPVASGRRLFRPDPPWWVWNEYSAWPEEKDIPIRRGLPAARSVVEILSKQTEPAVYLCLGPLTNLADAMAMDSGLQDRISKVVFYGTPPDAAVPGWNNERDPDSARVVFSSGISIAAIRIPDDRLPVVDDALNDGLQAATGASLGRGTISVVEDRPAPAAAFTHQDKTLMLRLNPAAEAGGLILVTNNEREFRRVPGLNAVSQSWSSGPAQRQLALLFSPKRKNSKHEIRNTKQIRMTESPKHWRWTAFDRCRLLQMLKDRTEALPESRAPHPPGLSPHAIHQDVIPTNSVPSSSRRSSALHHPEYPIPQFPASSR